MRIFDISFGEGKNENVVRFLDGIVEEGIVDESILFSWIFGTRS